MVFFLYLILLYLSLEVLDFLDMLNNTNINLNKYFDF